MADLNDLLVKTSRTFGLSIPLLPEPARQEITIAYLLFRIADTLEDASNWPTSERLGALSAYGRLLQEPSIGQARHLSEGWLASPPCDHEGYLELLRETAFILEKLLALSDEARRRISRHTLRTAEGMAGYVARSKDTGDLQLTSIEDLRGYCYVVAGIVGEMLTDVFLLHRPYLERFRPEMIIGSNRFGEGLQLVNILKDSHSDARDGRYYLPPNVDYKVVFEIARSGLSAGVNYILTLQDGGAPRGFMGFLVLPLFLAWATLDLVERQGPGNKVSRAEVGRLLACVQANFEDGGGPQFSRESLRGLYESVIGTSVCPPAMNSQAGGA